MQICNEDVQKNKETMLTEQTKPTSNPSTQVSAHPLFDVSQDV